MAALFIIFLMIISAVLLMLKRVRASLTLSIIAIISFIAIGNGFIPAMMLRQLQKPFSVISQPMWQPNNAIVLLGAGVMKSADSAAHPAMMAYSRINAAARLYSECSKNHHCNIIVSGGDTLKIGKSEAKVYDDYLQQLGVPKKNIILESNSLNTFKNAEYCHAILQQHHFDQVTLVTSAMHMPRALSYFSHFGIQAQPVVSDYLSVQISYIPQGYNFAMTDFALHEYLGKVRYHVYNLLGWNGKPSAIDRLDLTERPRLVPR